MPVSRLLTFEENTTETQYHQEPLVLPVTDYNSATITIMSALPDDAESRFAEFRYNKELAGDVSIDVYTPYLVTLQRLITSGCLLNLNDVPVLNINNPWWDQAIDRNLAISEKVYIQAEVILFSSKEKHCALAVNKNFSPAAICQGLFHHSSKKSSIFGFFSKQMLDFDLKNRF